MRKTLAGFLIITLLAACGIKRPLELPGYEKRKSHSEAEGDATKSAMP